MSNSQITLSKFFSFHEKEISQDRWSAVEASERISSLKEEASEKVKGIRWPVAFKEIISKVEDLLNIDLANIMVGAWKKSSELIEYLDRAAYPPDETLLVPLAEHSILSEHHPYIEVLIQDKPVGKIEFSINLALTLKGMVLKIKGGKIMEILTGSCQGKGTIKCENVVILEKKTASFALPGVIPLGEGIAIVS